MTTRTSTTCHKVPLENHWTLNVLTPRIATITDKSGNRKTAYFGFDTQIEAEAFQKVIIAKEFCSTAQVRKSQRLSHYPYEVKAWDTTTALLVHLLNRPTSKSLSL